LSLAEEARRRSRAPALGKDRRETDEAFEEASRLPRRFARRSLQAGPLPLLKVATTRCVVRLAIFCTALSSVEERAFCLQSTAWGHTIRALVGVTTRAKKATPKKYSPYEYQIISQSNSMATHRVDGRTHLLSCCGISCDSFQR